MSRYKAPNGSGKVTVHGYRLVMVDGKEIKEHRMVLAAVHGWEALEGMDVHHLNGDKLDNRIENLVLVTPADHIRLYHPKPNKYPHSHWEAIAETYQNGGATPTRAVANTFGVAYSQAASWVHRARLKGVLPPFQKAEAE